MFATHNLLIDYSISTKFDPILARNDPFEKEGKIYFVFRFIDSMERKIMSTYYASLRGTEFEHNYLKFYLGFDI